MKLIQPLLVIFALLLIACGQPDPGAAPTLAQPKGVIGRMSCAGGVFWDPEEVVVHADGRVQTSDASYTAKASKAQIKKLHQTLASDEWHKLKAVYGRNGVDVRGCLISGGGKQVTSRGQASPPILIDVETQLLALKRLTQPIVTITREREARKKVQTLQVFQDGTVHVLDGRHDENRVVGTAKMPRAGVRRLQEIFRSQAWESVSGIYDKDTSGKFQYTVHGVGGHNVVKYTEGTSPPKLLTDVFDPLDQYWSLPKANGRNHNPKGIASPLASPTSTRSR